MENCGVIYFSGTGNTKFVAENIKKVLEEKKFNVDLINIEDNKSIDASKYTYIFIGGPVYVECYLNF